MKYEVLQRVGLDVLTTPEGGLQVGGRRAENVEKVKSFTPCQQTILSPTLNSKRLEAARKALQ